MPNTDTNYICGNCHKYQQEGDKYCMFCGQQVNQQHLATDNCYCYSCLIGKIINQKNLIDSNGKVMMGFCPRCGQKTTTLVSSDGDAG